MYNTWQRYSQSYFWAFKIASIKTHCYQSSTPCLVSWSLNSEKGRIRFRGVRLQTLSSLSYFGLTEFRGASSVSSFQPFFVCQSELNEFLTKLPEFATELGEFSLPKQHSRSALSLWIPRKRSRQVWGFRRGISHITTASPWKLKARWLHASQTTIIQTSCFQNTLSEKHSCVNTRVAIPLAWYKCLNSQNAQKYPREGANGVFGPLEFLEWESQNSLLHGAKPRFRLLPPVRNKGCTCERPFLDSRPKDPKSLLAPSLKHFWAFGLFRHLGCLDTCTRPAGSQHKSLLGIASR